MIDTIEKVQRWVLVCMTLLVGVMVLSYFFGDRSGENWKLTTGTIRSAEFRAMSDGIVRSEDDDANCPQLAYEYEVDGKTLRGEGPAPLDDCRNNPSEQHRRLFAAGSRIRVLYDPAAPEQSKVLTLVYGAGAK